MKITRTLLPGLSGDDPLATIRLRVFLANHLASTENLTRKTKRQNTYQHKTNITQKVAPTNNSTIISTIY